MRAKRTNIICAASSSITGPTWKATIAGVPINLPTHAHGQGYSDINWLIPELVSFVEFDQGPYYAQSGDFSLLPARTRFFYKNTLPAPITEIQARGNYGYGNVLDCRLPKGGRGQSAVRLSDLSRQRLVRAPGRICKV